MASQIICYYFQRQQKSYLVNRHLRQNPDASLAEEEEEEEEAGEEESGEDDDMHNDEPSEYERERLRRIARNEQMVRDLGIQRAL